MRNRDDALLQTAIEVATRAHAGQTDKAGLPYIEHPLRVMNRLPADQIAGRIVAVLHDVIEDTNVTVADLQALGFDPEICTAIQTLTHAPDEGDQVYWQRIARSPLAKLVKLADIADNSDEKRLAHLPPEVAVRLRDKYANARRVLAQS